MAKGKDSLGNSLPEVGAICQTCNRTITSKCDRKRHYLCASNVLHAKRIAKRKRGEGPPSPDEQRMADLLGGVHRPVVVPPRRT